MIKQFSLGIVALLTACASGQSAISSAVNRVTATTSFGECWGHCATRLEVSPGQAVFILEPLGLAARDEAFAPRRFSMPLTPAEWREIQGLADDANFHALPDVIGCPDCDDSGAESLTIEVEGKVETVLFEHGADLPAVQPLLDRVRALRRRLARENAE